MYRNPFQKKIHLDLSRIFLSLTMTVTINRLEINTPPYIYPHKERERDPYTHTHTFKKHARNSVRVVAESFVFVKNKDVRIVPIYSCVDCLGLSSFDLPEGTQHISHVNTRTYTHMTHIYSFPNPSSPSLCHMSHSTQPTA